MKNKKTPTERQIKAFLASENPPSDLAEAGWTGTDTTDRAQDGR